MNGKLKILGIGELVWDVLPSGKKLGGAPVNFAFWCNELGAEGFPVTAVGNDSLAEESLAQLQNTGLDLSYIQHNDLPTGVVNVTLSGDGIPAYDIVQNVAWDAIEADKKTLGLAKVADAVCWGSLAQRSEKTRSSVETIIDALEQSCLKVFDINIRQNWYTKELIESSLNKADVLKLNEDELPLIADMFGFDLETAIASIIKEYSLKYIIYTVGADHSEIHGAEGMLSYIKTPSVKVVDTVGAGDSFTAAFITSLLSGKTVQESHAKAVEIAARVCTIQGAIPAK
jgi:fructokinase